MDLYVGNKNYFGFIPAQALRVIIITRTMGPEDSSNKTTITIRLIETLHKSDMHCFVRYEGFSYLGVCDEFFTELFRNRGCNLDIDFGREECSTMG